MIHLVNPLMNIRVLKANVDAIVNAFPEALAIKRISGEYATGEFLALHCLSATDNKPSFVVVIFENNSQYVFGPYKSYKAATKAIERRYVGTGNKARGYIAPLIPAPKLKLIGKRAITDKEWDE